MDGGGTVHGGQKLKEEAAEGENSRFISEIYNGMRTRNLVHHRERSKALVMNVKQSS